MIATCIKCHLDFITQKPARGPLATVCSKRACRRGKKPKVPLECLICRVPLEGQDTGRPRLFCSDDHKSVARWDREWQEALITDRDWVITDAVGYLPGSWHKEAPSKKARIGMRLSGAFDFDPAMFTAEDGSRPEWLVEFLKDFTPNGPDVGQTYRLPGLTLGKTS